jgi:WhiB family transcriptional regulator, redox-sensing transcriptional regulator
MTMNQTKSAHWQARAVCQGAPPELFVPDGDDEPEVPAPEAVRYCNVCPVRPECLEDALLHHHEGVWGGTSNYQRRQMRRKRTRQECPTCGGGDSLVSEGNNQQLCLACGCSWYIF